MSDAFERDLADVLRRTGDSFTPDAADLVAGGVRRGRTRRLRQRFAVIGGSVAGVAVLGFGGALVGSPDAAPPDPGVATTLPPGLAVEQQDLTGTLRKLLPHGTFTRTASQGAGASVTGVFDDGNGAAGIRVTLTNGDAADITCPDPALRAYDHCSTRRLADGSRVAVFQGFQEPNSLQEIRVWSADLITPDGGHVNVTEWNAPAEKGEPVTRAYPPLSLDQLTNLVTAQELRDMADTPE
ncbi:hypothetical protein ACVNF4_26430 [Streptomyces sp. S6]